MKENCSDRIKKALAIRNMKPVDLVELSGVKKSALSQYMSGKILPRQYALHNLAIALNVDDAWLMGFDVPMERTEKKDKVKTAARDEKSFNKYSRLDPKKKKIVDDLINNLFDEMEDVEDDEDILR